MKVIVNLLVVVFFALIGCSQTLIVQSQSLNLEFEQHEGGYPNQWGDFGSDGYKIYIDSLKAKNGRYSVVIENTGDSTGFRALSLILPDNYKGKSIRLSGYIKTEDVKEGFAGYR